MVMKKCKICGKEFDAKGRQICCSDKCKKENKLRNNRKAFKKMHEAGYNFNKYNERKAEEAYKEFNLLNDGYNSSLGIGKNNAYKLIKLPNFPVIKIGKKYIVPKDAFEEWFYGNGVK